MRPLQYLLSLPAANAEIQQTLAPPEWTIRSDPPGGLGSGGGTAFLLAEAWRASAAPDFGAWLRGPGKMIIHGGGQSRRLPAYGPVGKPFLPLPILRGEIGQRLDQTLLDFQKPVFESVFSSAPLSYVAAVASGDVLLRFSPLSAPLPEADVLALGMPATPEMAQAFGVFFFQRSQPETLAFFLQKPSADQIRQLSEEYFFLVDTGFWLLSERAVDLLMERCGWDAGAQTFSHSLPLSYELYARFGPALGAVPAEPDPVIGALTTAVLGLADSEFYHLGTNRQMIESVSRLQNRRSEQAGWGETRPHPDQFVQNSVFDPPIRRAANHTLWIENSVIPASWQLASEHVLTGVPANNWALTLERGVCLDFVPIGETDYCVRVYGIDDAFRGRLSDPETLWLAGASEWAAKRGFSWADAGIDADGDIYEAALFPVLPLSQITGGFLEWLFAADPNRNDVHTALWRSARRLSAQQLNREANTGRIAAQREETLRAVLPLMRRRPGRSAFYNLDLAATARLMTQVSAPLIEDIPEIAAAPPLVRMQDAMLRAALLRESHSAGADQAETEAFEWLRQSLLDQNALAVEPVRDVLEDQILWGRSPLRFDLAGGWTDTPPYCLTHGGRVLNIAVDLNGQPPVQVFARPTKQPELVLRSIDLGLERRIRTFEELDTFAHHGAEFALAKAALALAGFLPRFRHRSAGTLAEQLSLMGGGIELSLLAAVPAGSGLGTSSILAATLLGTLSEFYGLGWDRQALVTRTLLLEQLVTTGGGWQDQAGGLYPGVKLLETGPDPAQKVSVRWAADSLFAPAQAGPMLLYYTGITRLAKHILQDIVRGMFLGDGRVMACLRDIGENAGAAYDALGTGSYEALCERVWRSWELNQRLDAGTNPPEVQAIFAKIAPYLAAAKLTGAGGGGYLFLMARDDEAARRIQEKLTAEPPNPRARFVKFSLSHTGMQITRS